MSEIGGSGFKVVVSAEARRHLHQLPPKIGLIIVEFVTTTLRDNPARLSKPLRPPFEGLRSARRGDYRVLFDLDETTRVINIIRITHRSDAYRP